MRRVLRTIPSYFPLVTGPANQARAISRGLRPHGFESLVLTTALGADSDPERDVIDGIEVVRAPIQTSFMQYHLAWGAWPELKRRPAELIHAHCYRNFLTDAAALAAAQHNIPFILHLHGTLAMYRKVTRQSRWWLYQGYDRLTRPLRALQADHVIVSTDEERGEAEAYGLDPSRISVIPMGIQLDDYQFRDVQSDPAHIVFVGRLTEDRNPALLLRALALLRELPWSCEIVGDETRRSFATNLGYGEQLQQLVHDLGIAQRVRFTGQLHGEALRRAYARAGIFVYPSHYENFGQTILEAAAAGCALLTTPVGVAHDLVREGVSGFHISPGSPEALAACLRRLLERPAVQWSMGEAARQLVERNYAWQPILKRYADLYENVIADRRGATSGRRISAIDRRPPTAA